MPTLVDNTIHVLLSSAPSDMVTLRGLYVPGAKHQMDRRTELIVKPLLAAAFCLVIGGLVSAFAQTPQKTNAGEQAWGQIPKPSEADGEWSPALTGERRPFYRFQKSDVIEIEFTFSPELNETVTVEPDGFVSLRGARPVQAEGQTGAQLAETIRQAYRGILQQPEVTVFLRDFDKPFFIAAGEVARPGKYELQSETTVTAAVAIAGGFTTAAKHSQVVLFRRISGDMVETHVVDVKAMLKKKDLTEDLALQPGDMLFAPQNMISKIKPFMPISGMSLYLNPAQF
jgi:polysaccharide biosynthesis/export protein